MKFLRLPKGDSDILKKAGHHLLIWKSLALVTLGGSILASVAIAALYEDYASLRARTKEKLIIVPPGPTALVDKRASRILAQARRAVGLLENWSFETIGENYAEIFRSYATPTLETFLRANLAESHLMEIAKKQNLVSIWRINRDLSRAAFSEKLNAGCALIVGERILYKDGNEAPVRRKVAYFFASTDVYPRDNAPESFRIDRLMLDDTSEDPYRSLEYIYTSAVREGVIPQGERYAER